MSDSQEKKPALLPAIKIYLLIYNVVQSVGWSWILHSIIAYYAEHGTLQGASSAYTGALKWFQMAALLEVVHAAFGMTSSSAMTTFVQIQSRMWFVWLLLPLCPEVTQSSWATFMILCWTLTEIIRYLYYTSALMNYRPYALMWLRYSMFIVMYPCGVTAELSCAYLAFNEYAKTGMLSMKMPNMFNFTFYIPYVIILSTLQYIPSMPHLYLHILSQRGKKILGTAAKR